MGLGQTSNYCRCYGATSRFQTRQNWLATDNPPKMTSQPGRIMGQVWHIPQRMFDLYAGILAWFASCMHPYQLSSDGISFCSHSTIWDEAIPGRVQYSGLEFHICIIYIGTEFPLSDTTPPVGISSLHESLSKGIWFGTPCSQPPHRTTSPKTQQPYYKTGGNHQRVHSKAFKGTACIKRRSAANANLIKEPRDWFQVGCNSPEANTFLLKDVVAWLNGLWIHMPFQKAIGPPKLTSIVSNHLLRRYADP